jgi:Domain of unknown function (DUF222)
VLAEQATLDGQSHNPGYAPGFGPIPAPLLREMATTANLHPVPLPAPCAGPGYRPSAKLARFVRCRDLTCRFPGCEAAAAVCQLDHTIPYPFGPTHPSNLKLLCVFHRVHKSSRWRNEFRRNPPLRRSDDEEVPFAGHTLELVSAALLELES